MIFELSEDRVWFPEIRLAEEDGLLAFGGNLSPERLLLAYKSGIFPWYSDETPILWYSPHQRFVLFPEKIKISRSLKKVLNQNQFQFTFDQAFSEVIDACAVVNRKGQDGTWITQDMKAAYTDLFHLGIAHSVEVWYQGELAGGLYGVEIDWVFCGESMFTRVNDASKAALVWLCLQKQYKMIDCQVHSAHLESMGAEIISRDKYFEILQNRI